MKLPSYEAVHATPDYPFFSMQYEIPFKGNIKIRINNFSNCLIFGCKDKRKDVTPQIHESQRIWNRYTEKVPIDLLESKWDRNIPRYLLSLTTRFDDETTLLEYIWIDPQLSLYLYILVFPIQVNGAVSKVQNAHYS